MEINWNEEQRAIIDSRGHDLAVSASAGSGKTTVMLERVRRLIVCDNVPIRRIVILSFNESIAAEIKSRLYLALEMELLNGGRGYAANAFIEEQLDSIDKADISTTDAFCNRLICEYFDRLGLDPSISVGDEKENKMRLKKSVKAVIKSAKERGDDEYYELRNKLGGDKNLIDAVLKTYYYAIVRPDAESWLKSAHQIYDKGIDSTGFIGELASRFGAWYSDTCDRLEEALVLASADREKAVLPYLLIDIVRLIIGAKSYRDIYYATKTELPKQSYTKAVFGEYKVEIAALTKRLTEGVKSAAKLFDLPLEEAERVHRSISADAKKIAELALMTMREYRRVKDGASVIDFSDMTYYAAKLLKDDETAEEIRSKYDYIFVDEYQDQNYIADYILSRISRDNLFTVGDVKQSIYGFRLAEPAIMINRCESFAADDAASARELADSKAMRLNYNYRSDKAILDAVNGVFDTAMRRAICGVEYALTERFLPQAEYPDNGVEKFKAVFFTKGESEDAENAAEAIDDKAGEPADNDALFNPNKRARKEKKRGVEESEGEYIADKIEELIASGIYDGKAGKTRRVSFNDICILSRERLADGSELDKIINVLLSRGYPVDASGVIKNKEVKEIELIIDMLRVIDNTTDEIPLAAALRSVWGGLTSAELYEIRRASPSLSFAEAVMAAKDNAKITRFYELIDKCRAELARKKLADVIAMLVYDYGYESELVRDKAKLRCVQQYIASLEGYGGTLSEYLATADSGVEYEGASDSAENGCIKTSTIHKSKGLEYPIVFLVGAGKRFNLRDEPIVTFKNYGIGVNAFDSATLSKKNAFTCDMLNLIKREEERNEEMRLLYVAMTRAMNHLFICGVLPKSNASEDSYTLPNKVMCYKDWISNAAAAKTLPRECVEVRTAEPLRGGKPEIIELARDITFAKRAIEEYVYKPYRYDDATRIGLKHTVTELVSQQRYEDEFIYKPSDYGDDVGGVDKAARGTDYHTILEHIDYSAVTPEAVAAELERMVDEGVLEREQIEIVDLDELAAIMRSDIISLARITPHRREQEFTLAVKASEFFDCDTDDEIIVQGAIDLIIMGKELIIVDFKKSNKSREELIRAYSLQLKLYARAAAEALGRPIDKTLLYSISSREAIEIIL